jgi:hypothetical protein
LNNISEIRLSRLTSDPQLRQWFERNEPDAGAVLATVDKPRQPIAGAAAEFEPA